MSEEKSNNISEEMLRRLKDIGADLWGNLPAAAAAVEKDEASDEPLNPDIEEAWRQMVGIRKDAAGRKTAEKGAAGSDAVRPAAPARKQELPPAAVTAEKKPLTLDNLWRTADETVDWTDAMLHTSSRDGLTEQKKWSFYHRMAPRVLAGDTEAYAEVLTTENPLGDLAEYTAGMVLRTPDAERVECVFECREEHLSQREEDYLGAVSLRVARDLLAVLPISEVTVTGNLQGREILKVTYGRSQLLKKNVAFLNPADFARECGAVISAE